MLRFERKREKTNLNIKIVFNHLSDIVLTPEALITYNPVERLNCNQARIHYMLHCRGTSA